MDLVEIRDLDGPNIFLLEPAIKLEIAVTGDDSRDPGALARRLGLAGSAETAEATVGELLRRSVVDLHERSGAPAPRTVVESLETPGRLAVAFGWDHRRFAMQVAEAVGDAVVGKQLDVPVIVAGLRGLREEIGEDDRPALVTDADRKVRA
ncbi:MAG TPA: hypothetical protein VKB09_01350, partial [Thermomicrobiales bacterium]|nr:hypothetical protein [Thermomicrobiales bacterium]